VLCVSIKVKLSVSLLYVQCTVSQKNIPNIFDCNLKKDYMILIIFGKNIPETTGHQIIM